MTNRERKWMDRVAKLGCICCRQFGKYEIPCQIHHLREGQGMGQRNSNFMVIGLCPHCHTGPQGIHGDKTYLKLLKMDELDLLAETLEALV